jgi:hypothetical protein
MKTVAILILLTMGSAIGCGSVDAARVSDADPTGGMGGVAIGQGGVAGASEHDASADVLPTLDASLDANTPPNLVAQNAAAWMFTPPTIGTATTAFTAGNYCATLMSNSTAVATIGWTPTQSVALPAGTTFEFSYQASSTAPLWTFLAKVGSTTPPTYTVDFQTTTDSPATAPQTFTHTFTSPGDTAAGIAFVFSTDSSMPVTVCISDVALRQVGGGG